MVTEEEIEKLEKEFSADISMFLREKDNSDLLDSIYKLSFILSNIKKLQAAEQQITFMNTSQELLKDVDFSKIDINGVLQGMMKGEV